MVADHRAESDTAPLADRLVNRLGADRVAWPIAVDSHIPERAETALPSTAGKTHRRCRGHRSAARPLRLFKAPEPVEVVAMVPDSPPVMLFWRGTTHRITAAEGPERIASERWIEKTPPRDYYRVQDAEGRAFGFIGTVPMAARSIRAGISTVCSLEMAGRQLRCRLCLCRAAGGEQFFFLEAVPIQRNSSPKRPPRPMPLRSRTAPLVGVVRAHLAAKDLPIRLIIGAWLDLVDGPSLLVYPQDWQPIKPSLRS